MSTPEAESPKVLYTSPGVSVRVRQRPVPTQTMVNAAIRSQMTKPSRGVSLAAIKKYIAQNYLAAQADLRSRLTYIKRYIATALQKGSLVRTSGTGISGSFRLSQHKPQAPKKRARKVSKPQARRRKPKVARAPLDDKRPSRSRPHSDSRPTTTTS